MRITRADIGAFLVGLAYTAGCLYAAGWWR